VGVAVGAAVFVGAGFGGGVAVGLGVGVGGGVGAAMTSGDGTAAGELATSALAAVVAGIELSGAALETLVVAGGSELVAGVDAAPVDDG
jgi:hypothetical protein